MTDADLLRRILGAMRPDIPMDWHDQAWLAAKGLATLEAIEAEAATPAPLDWPLLLVAVRAFQRRESDASLFGHGFDAAYVLGQELEAAGVTLAATPAPLDAGEHYVGDGCDEHVLVRRVPSVRESSARLGITMTEHNAPEIVHPAPFEDDSEWASLGNIECRCGDVFPTVEAMHEHIHLSHPNADHDVLDIPPTIAEAYEQGMLAERALATPAPLDGLRAALDGVMSRVRLDLVSGGTDQRYSPAEVAVLVRQAVEGTYVAIAAAYAEEAPDEGNEWQERNE